MAYISVLCENQCYWEVLGKISNFIKKPIQKLIWGGKNRVDAKTSRDVFNSVEKNICVAIINKTMHSNDIGRNITNAIRDFTE